MSYHIYLIVVFFPWCTSYNSIGNKVLLSVKLHSLALYEPYTHKLSRHHGSNNWGYHDTESVASVNCEFNVLQQVFISQFLTLRVTNVLPS